MAPPPRPPLVIHCPRCQDRRVQRGSKYFPFCSAECQGRDLAGWIFGEYRVPAEAVEPPDEEESTPLEEET